MRQRKQLQFCYFVILLFFNLSVQKSYYKIIFSNIFFPAFSHFIVIANEVTSNSLARLTFFCCEAKLCDRNFCKFSVIKLHCMETFFCAKCELREKWWNKLKIQPNKHARVNWRTLKLWTMQLCCKKLLGITRTNLVFHYVEKLKEWIADMWCVLAKKL